jgi:hypothetical protein
MVKYLSSHNSSFALKYYLKCKWQGNSVTHPLAYFVWVDQGMFMEECHLL